MKGLIIKDLYTFPNNKRTLAVQFLIFTCCSFALRGGSRYMVTLLTLLAVGIITGTFAYDESSRWDQYAATLPIKRKAVVLAKYIFAFISLIAASAVAFGVAFLLDTLFGQPQHILLLTTVLLVLGLSFISVSVILVVAFRFGSEKARLASAGFYMLFVALFFLAYYLFSRPLASLLASPLFLLGLAAGVFVVSRVIFAGSYFMAASLYSKRDF